MFNKILGLGLAALILVGVVFYIRYFKAEGGESAPLVDTTKNKLKEKAEEAKAYCKANNLNTDFCILVDFSIHSGKKRLFVWDFKTDSIRVSGLCCHGKGGESTASTPEFKNIEGSLCSSLGKYRIGVQAPSKWGIKVHYKMHGLEETNNKAFKRFIVLHSYAYVPEKETYPVHLPLGMSEGCPVISDRVMTQIDELMKKTETSPLLWIFT